MRAVLAMDSGDTDAVELGRYGLGTVRSLQYYEHYAGVHFASRGVHPATLRNVVPPTPGAGDSAGWLKSMHVEHFLEIHVLASRLDPERRCEVWWITFHSADGSEHYRRMISGEAVREMATEDGYIVEALCYSPEPPAICVIYPYFEESGWDEPLVINVSSVDAGS